MCLSIFAKDSAFFGMLLDCFFSRDGTATRTRRLVTYRFNRFQMIAPTNPKIYPITAVITTRVTAASGSNGLTTQKMKSMIGCADQH
jgi:hypothetical protein